MADLATTLPAPLKTWDDGTIRVGSTRVLLANAAPYTSPNAELT